MKFSNGIALRGRAISLVAIFFCVIVLAACGGGGGAQDPASGGTTNVTTPVAVLPSASTANVGDVLSFSINGGSPAYSITVNNSSIASVSASSVASSGGTFTATLLNVGSTTVSIVDRLGQTTTLTLTVTNASASLRLSPSALLIGEDYLGGIVFNIYGGTAPYIGLSSDYVLTSVSSTGTSIAPTLTVGLGSKGTRCINPVDSANAYVVSGTYDITVTVVDSLGASATSILTIKDNGKGLSVSGCQ